MFTQSSQTSTLCVVSGFFVVKFVPLLITWKCVPLVDLLIAVMGRAKWPTTYTRYFELGMQLSPALQSLFPFHLGCDYG